MPKRKGQLNEQERRFVDAFFGKAKGNATKAAILAGYSRKNARSQASRLLTRANIQKALAGRRDRREQDSIAEADERDRYFSTFLRDEHLDIHARLIAGKELNKVSGRHSILVNVKGKLTLEEALGASRKGDE